MPPRLIISLVVFLTAVTASTARDAVEGEWRLLGSRVEFEIKASDSQPDAFEMLLVDSPDMSLVPGTVIGSMQRTPTPGRYIASMAVNPSHKRGRKRQLLVRLTDSGTLSFEPYRTGHRISLWRWIPYLFRVTVVERNDPPANINGAVRTGANDLSRHRVL